MAGGGSFRTSVWDPLLILSQMASLQGCYYLFLCLWMSFFDLCVSSPRSLDQIFKYQFLSIGHPFGKLVIAAYFCNALTCSLCLWYIVERTKLCLDYTCTVHFFHVLFCWMYNAVLPNTLSWWIVNVVCIAVMCVSGEFLCMRTELRAIPVSMSSASLKTDL